VRIALGAFVLLGFTVADAETMATALGDNLELIVGALTAIWGIVDLALNKTRGAPMATWFKRQIIKPKKISKPRARSS
jgi:hypothetical protein